MVSLTPITSAVAAGRDNVTFRLPKPKPASAVKNTVGNLSAPLRMTIRYKKVNLALQGRILDDHLDTLNGQKFLIIKNTLILMPMDITQINTLIILWLVVVQV